MKRRTAIILAIIALVIIGGIIYSSRNKQVPIETYDVTKKDIVQTVSATGELKSESDLALNFETVGRIETIKALTGEEVAEGETIATIDSSNLNQDVANAKAALDKAMAQAGINDEEIKRLQTLIDNAEAVLKDTKDAENQKVSAAEQDVEDTKRSYEDAVEYYNQVVSESGSQSLEAKTAKLTVNTALRSYNGAKETEETTEKLKDLAITSAENNLDSAEDNLAKARSKSQALFDDATVSVAQAQYESAKNNLEKSILKAPTGGTITKINFKKGEVLGSSLATPFARMVSKDLMIEANIAESDIAKIKIGNSGTVTFDAFGDDEEFDMEVLSVEPAATVIQDVVYYVVKFKLQTANDIRLKPGMTANIEIETNKKSGVIAIPERLVAEENGQRYVEVIENGNRKRSELKLGMRGDEGLVEVTSGLKTGDKVVATTTISQ